MKSPILIALSFLLATAILAPSVITITGMDNVNGFVLDLGEEENKKEGKKEVVEKDFLFSLAFDSPAGFGRNSSAMSSYYFERNYFFLRTIVLPPPESTT